MRETTASPATDAVEVVGVVERIVYESRDTGFFVGRMRRDDTNELVTFVGSLMAVSPGETIRIRGHWVDDKRFGRQIRTESYQTVLPTCADGIEKYLSSGLIRGIGSVYAKRLVDAFGVETLRVIDEEPGRLRGVEGIGPKRAEQIREAWSEQKSIQSIMLFLQSHGVGTAQAVRIFKRYGDGAVAVLRENPYRLAEDISGIGFAGADAIAQSLGIASDSPKRLEAGLHFVLQQGTRDGHSYLSQGELITGAAELLGAEASQLDAPLESVLSRKLVVREDDAYFLDTMHAAECGIDHQLKRILRMPKESVEIDGDRAVVWVEKTQGINLSEEQGQAVKLAGTANVMVITGGPGTGKTTLINCLLSVLEKKGLHAMLAAPTGRAAKRMEAATDREARTIHRMLEFSPKQGGFVRNTLNPLNAEVFVIDETSMVDAQLMDALLQAIPDHARLFLIGDVDQLPSVGPGNVLMDLIASGVIPIVRLKTVFRQAAESGIVANAHRVNRGEIPEATSEDFFIIERKDPPKAADAVVELVTSRIPKKFGLDPLRDVQVLAPMHRGDTGVAHLNEVLQQALNPEGEEVPRRNFRVGDKVIQTRNNYDLDVFNGDLGVIASSDADLKELQVRFDDRVVVYGFDEMDDLSLAYAITVHKAQGSEYPAVVLTLLSQHYMMLQRNVLYTAITRAERLVTIVGDPKALGIAVRNTKVSRRNTKLSERLRNDE